MASSFLIFGGMWSGYKLAHRNSLCTMNLPPSPVIPASIDDTLHHLVFNCFRVQSWPAAQA